MPVWSSCFNNYIQKCSMGSILSCLWSNRPACATSNRPPAREATARPQLGSWQLSGRADRVQRDDRVGWDVVLCSLRPG